MSTFWIIIIVAAAAVACLSPVWVGALSDSLKRRRAMRQEQIAKGYAEVRALPRCPCGRGIQLDEGLCCSCIEWNVERLSRRPVSKRYDPAGMIPEFLKPKPKPYETRAWSSTALGRTLLGVGIRARQCDCATTGMICDDCKRAYFEGPGLWPRTVFTSTWVAACASS